MAKESKWYLDNNCFFDTFWAFWFAHKSKIYWFEEPMSAYRVLPNSDCHSQNPQKRYLLDKRYFAMKTYFLLSQKIAADEAFDILLSEYDYLHQNAYYEGVCSVHNSKSYKIGKRITSFFKCFKTNLK